MGYGYYYDPTYILVVIGFIITLIAEIGVKGSYSKYKKINASKKMTGQEVARKILDANGLDNVQVKEVGGTLSDHYNPSDKTVNLSTDIYNFYQKYYEKQNVLDTFLFLLCAKAGLNCSLGTSVLRSYTI